MPSTPGFTLITAAKIQDASGRLLSSGRVSFFPVTSAGAPVSAIAGGGGGVITQTGVVFQVVNGAITEDLYGNPAQVADTTLTTPTNIGYMVTVTDQNGAAIQGPGYGFVQPFGATWSLDNWSSSLAPLPTTPNTLIVDGVTGLLYFVSVNLGQLVLFPIATGTQTPTAIVFADTVTGVHWALTFSNGARGLTDIGSLGTPIAGMTFIDEETENRFTLQVTEGSLEETQVSSISSGVASYTLADVANGALHVLRFVNGAFTY
jgi:hypothetical protein